MGTPAASDASAASRAARWMATRSFKLGPVSMRRQKVNGMIRFNPINMNTRFRVDYNFIPRFSKLRGRGNG